MKDDSTSAVVSQSSTRVLRYSRPSKEAVRAWLLRLIAAKKPPPAMADIQDDLWYVPRAQGMKDDP